MHLKLEIIPRQMIMIRTLSFKDIVRIRKIAKLLELLLKILKFKKEKGMMVY